MAGKKKRVVLSGYYGFDNCGDEAVLLAIIKSLRSLVPDLEITVLSGNPEKTAAAYGVKAVPRFKIPSVIRSLFGADLLISGGGSLLQDVTSAKSPLYYLGIITLGQLFARKNMVYAQGIGPLNIKENQQRTIKVFKKCDVITVRDQGSLQDLLEMGLDVPIEVVADPVMGLQAEDIPDDPGCRILKELALADDQGKMEKPLLVVALRTWQENQYYGKVAAVLDRLVENGWNVLLIPMHFPQDTQAVQEVTKNMTQRFYCLGENLNPQELMSVIKKADLVLSMRLHGLIMAMALEVPMVALSYDPKVERFMEETGLNSCLSLENFTAEELQKVIDRLIKEKPQLKEIQKAKRRELYTKAWRAARMAEELLAK